MGSNEIIGPSWDPQQPANGPAPVGSQAGYISDIPHSVFSPCYSDGIPICVTFIGDYFGLAVHDGTAYSLSVSTYPMVQNGQTVDAWSQATGELDQPGLDCTRGKRLLPATGARDEHLSVARACASRRGKRRGAQPL